MKLKFQNQLKILPNKLRAVLSSSFALMTIIPLLVAVLLIILNLANNFSMALHLMTLIIFVTMGTALVGFLLLSRVVRSIVRLAEHAKQVSEGKEIKNIEYFEEENEIGAIVSSFNSVVARLDQKIQELQKVNEELELLSITDELTGLYNFRSFKEFLEREVSRSMRKKYDIALLMLDLDDFKIFNDQYGHSAGNEYLKEMARLLQVNVRRYDIVARYGGDEFAIILPETDLAAAEVVAHRIKEVLSSATVRTSKGTHHFISLSMGLASRHFGPEIVEDAFPGIVEAADQALYAAKKRGKGFLETYRRAS